MTLRGPIALFSILMVLAVPAMAQTQPDPEAIQKLERRIDDLLRQASDLKRELDALKGAAAAAPADDLTKVDVVTAPPSPAPAPVPSPVQAVEAPAPAAVTAPEQPATALTDVQALNNQVSPGASKIFNPDTSVIGTFVGRAGERNPWELGGELRPAMQLDEAEVAFEAFVDPYAKAKFFLSAGPEGLEIEEGFAQFITLPYDLTAKAGRVKALFGKANTWHTHVRPWVDQPLVIHNFFGDEQFADSGISISKVFPNDFAFVEGTAEVYRGNVDNVFGRSGENRLAWNSHLKMYRDLSENSNIEIGTSYARGGLPGYPQPGLPENAVVSGSSRFAGVDVSYRWKPLREGLYKSLIARVEGIINDRDDLDRQLRGYYASLDYQLGKRWFAGVRLDSAGRVLNDLFGGAAGSTTDRGVSATLTFWPSEFTQFRTQLRRTSYGDVRRTANELLFQLQFAIGAHGAHTF